ncbi:MAG: thiamine pyrophosphate-dependent enzyme, partial [Actinomycetota bacterium]|nr:thiamine pyrophosphate-dependent enzyme [Actinomycetota bacterium]
WPLLAEPSSGSRTGDAPIAAYRLLLGADRLGGAVERVVVVGHPTLSRPVTRLLARDDVEVVVVATTGRWTDPGHRAVQLAREVVAAQDPGAGPWTRAWHEADTVAMGVVDRVLAQIPGPTPLGVARDVSQAVPPNGLLVVGSSNPVRDLDLMALAPPVGERRMVMANRGLSGIDGLVSTAVGIALARRPARAFAYVGDLTFLHDTNGLLIGPEEPRPDLTVVVVNDDGGSIFAGLEQGSPERAGSFERVFATPTGTDLEQLCRAHRVAHRRVADSASLQAALAAPQPGIEVVEVRVDRRERRALDARIRCEVADAIG